VLVAPDIIKNLLSIRQFTTDNLVSVEFDPLGVSVKDLRTRSTLLRSNSPGAPLHFGASIVAIRGQCPCDYSFPNHLAPSSRPPRQGCASQSCPVFLNHLQQA
jgi:hypothetical protein